MQTVFLTGANRGIGLEFARQYAAEGWRVIAACRRPDNAKALAALKGSVEVHGLDVTNDGEIDALGAALSNEAIDVLINNAGILHRGDGLGRIDTAAWVETFRVNAIAPLRVAERLLPAVLRGDQKRIVSITSQMGSIADNTSGGYYSYRTSKAALNMAMKSLSIDLKPQKVIVAVFHPGWVKTDMGGAGAAIEPSASVAGMRRKIAALGAADSGGFFNYDGARLPW
jgi:NAD(P)-dependent dehydrogenase (short-subunit alcohol dehydrogenase family)